MHREHLPKSDGESCIRCPGERQRSRLQVESAGTAALVGKTISPNAVKALEEIGVFPIDHHHARQVDEAMLVESDLILAMTPRTLRRCTNIVPTLDMLYTRKFTLYLNTPPAPLTVVCC